MFNGSKCKAIRINKVGNAVRGEFNSREIFGCTVANHR